MAELGYQNPSPTETALFPFDPNPNNDEENAAIALLMLSRDTCPSYAKISTTAADFVTSNNARTSDSSSSGDVNKAINAEFSYGLSVTLPGKKQFHECDVCGKLFGSHQALGGHKTRHRKRVSPNSSNTGSVVICDMNINSGGRVDRSDRLHQCATCYKIFPTGQALGGHMRKHFVRSLINGDKNASDDDTGNNNSNRRVNLNFDLNLLPPDPEEIYLDSGYSMKIQNIVGDQREEENPNIPSKRLRLE